MNSPAVVTGAVVRDHGVAAEVYRVPGDKRRISRHDDPGLHRAAGRIGKESHSASVDHPSDLSQFGTLDLELRLHPQVEERSAKVLRVDHTADPAPCGDLTVLRGPSGLAG